MFRGVNWEGSLFLSDCSRECFWFLLLLPFCSGYPFVVGLLFWEVIITVWEATRILSSNIEYLFARLYSYSIVAGGSRDSDWKKGVVSPKLLRKFLRTASLLYASICWIACPNLLVKSLIDSSSFLKMVCSEMMFRFCRTKHKYWETNAAHNSLNELMDPLGSLWNQARAGPFRLARNTLHRRWSFPALIIIAWLKCSMWSGSKKPLYMENDDMTKPRGGS